ncbi:MAG TPA: carboxypeptidase-like regulatory domain-containing protein, partial [Candidatus Sulfopaludibacter sp.]|nr:carboxypeptidase-like regulatory domain-containing protein [Candidatus Sulfopaludibacter sp.]
MRACYLILLVGAALRAQPASVEGVVVNQEDGHPMSGVHVSLTGREQAYGAVSRQDGHFSMAAVPAGSYQLEAERTGFLLARKPGDAFVRFVHLKAGQQVTGFTVTMTARAVLMGRVLDEAGDPVPGVGVGISSLPGSPPVSPFGLSLTNDRGEFRIVVLPGKYHLKAAPGVLRSGQTNDPPEIRTDGSSEMNYGDTYYPNSATAAGAAPVQANAGRDATGLDIRLARELNLSVSGSVTGPQGPASGATVWLRSAERQRAASAGADGRFRYTHVAAGTYEIFAQIAGAATMQSPPVEVRVAAGSEPDVPLLLSPGGDLTGTMEVEGEAGPGKRSVRLRPIGVAAGGSQVLGSTVGANGSFQMSLVAP